MDREVLIPRRRRKGNMRQPETVRKSKVLSLVLVLSLAVLLLGASSNIFAAPIEKAGGLMEVVPLSDPSYGDFNALAGKGYFSKPFPKGEAMPRYRLAQFAAEAMETAQIRSDNVLTPPDSSDLEMVSRLAKAYQQDLLSMKEDLSKLEDSLVAIQMKQKDLEGKESKLFNFLGIHIAGNYYMGYQGFKMSFDKLSSLLQAYSYIPTLFNDFGQSMDVEFYLSNPRVTAYGIQRFTSGMDGTWDLHNFPTNQGINSGATFVTSFNRKYFKANFDTFTFSAGDVEEKWSPLTLYTPDDDDLDPFLPRIFEDQIRFNKNFGSLLPYVADNQRLFRDSFSGSTTFRLYEKYDIDFDAYLSRLPTAAPLYAQEFSNDPYALYPTQWATQSLWGNSSFITETYTTWIFAGRTSSRPFPWLTVGGSLQDLQQIADTAPSTVTTPPPLDLYIGSEEATWTPNDMVTIAGETATSGFLRNLRNYPSPALPTGVPDTYFTDFAGKVTADFKNRFNDLSLAYRSVGPAFYNPMAQTRVLDPAAQFNYTVMGIQGYTQDSRLLDQATNASTLFSPVYYGGELWTPYYVNKVVPGFVPYSIVEDNTRPYGEATPNRNAATLQYTGHLFEDALQPGLMWERAWERVGVEGPGVSQLAPRTFNLVMAGLKFENRSLMGYVTPLVIQGGYREEQTNDNLYVTTRYFQTPFLTPPLYNSHPDVDLLTQSAYFGAEIPLLEEVVFMAGAQQIASRGYEYGLLGYPGLSTYGIIASDGSYNSLGGNAGGLHLIAYQWDATQSINGLGLSWKMFRSVQLNTRWQETIYHNKVFDLFDYTASELYTSILMRF